MTVGFLGHSLGCNSTAFLISFFLSLSPLQLKFSREYLSMSRCKVSFVADNLMDYTDTFLEFDPMLVVPGPSNPWITDDQTHWLLNQPM